MTEQTPNQARFTEIVKAIETPLVGHPPEWIRLAGLPDEICKVLCEYAIAVRDGSAMKQDAQARLYCLSQLNYEQIGQILELLKADFDSLKTVDVDS